MILYYCYKKSQKVPYLGALKRGPREKKPPLGGGQKEEIQQWRQARSRPGEKETLNIMLRERRT